MKNLGVVLWILMIGSLGYSQKYKVEIVTEDISNRIAFYALNKNEKDLDVLLTISGTNFRQSRGRPRFIRVPATSKVHMKTIVLMRDKTPTYTYKLQINDSLSSRSLIKEYEEIKIDPPNNILVYITEGCQTCDSLISALDSSKYNYKKMEVEGGTSLYEQLQMSFGPEVPLDSIVTPIVNIGGKLFTRLETYDLVVKEALKP
ncbi:hypothetical protein [Eudoraea chungangensis]|uniref:hypothetical protein n=1 Tax=Eudoraea chungangensis TaxID=1481905 RepID=UPI0023EC375F|nr:hypothetical protein [Eudoraea chungangensis]